VTFSDIQGGWTGAGGTGNLNPPQDPQFVDSSVNNYHIPHGSPVMNVGQGTDASWNPPIPDDTFDGDDDSATAEAAPECDRKVRARAASNPAPADMGSYEVQGLCPGDCALFDGVVDVSDLNRVLAEYGKGGACDFDNDSEVDVLDLLVVLGHWGPCPSGFAGGGSGGGEGEEEAMMSGEGDETLALIEAFIEAMGGLNDSTVPLLAAFLEHLDSGGQ
jgi:hypothetical protein